MPTVMVDIRYCDSWWQRNGEASYAAAAWPKRCDMTGSPNRFFNPPLTPEERGDADAEGWIPNLVFHGLRRTAARNLRRAGVAEGVIMKIGGWRTRSVFERYAIVAQSDIKDAMPKLEAQGTAIPAPG